MNREKKTKDKWNGNETENTANANYNPYLLKIQSTDIEWKDKKEAIVITQQFLDRNAVDAV